MPSNHAAWQPSLTIHLASAKIKLTTVGLTQRLGELGNYFDNRSNPKRPVLRVMKIEKSQKNTRDIIKDMEIPITQSKEWQKLQNDLGKTSFFESASDFQYLAILNKTPVGNYLYLPYGPVAKDEKSFQAALTSLNTIAKKTRAIFIRVEPQSTSFIKYLPKNSRKSKDLNPKDTWVLDLTPDKATLLTNFSQGTRTRYNTYAKKGLSVEFTKDPAELKHLVALQNKLFKTKNLNTFSEAYFKTELAQPFTTLYLVKYYHPAGKERDENTPKDGQVLAASLFFDYQDTRYYMQSAADTDYKKLPATVALLTTALFDAKEQGIKYFDFWGIAPEDAPDSHPWKGFTKFKQSFGGRPVAYAGTYDIILSPAKYHLYRLTRKINRFLRRI